MKFGELTAEQIRAKYEARRRLAAFRDKLKREQRLKIEPAVKVVSPLPIARSDFIKPITRAQLMAGK